MNKKGEFSFWQALIWIGAIIILAWAILKSFGVIESPLWVELLPYYGVGITLLGVAYGFGKLVKEVKDNSKNIRESRSDFSILREDFTKVKHIQTLCLNGKLRQGFGRRV